MADELLRELPGDLPTFWRASGPMRSAGPIWRWAAGPMGFAAPAAGSARLSHHGG